MITVGTLLVASGCTPGSLYPYGLIYNSTTMPHGMDRQEVSGQARTGDKLGEACAMGFLGLAAFGDASIDAAKKEGAITEVHSVEFKHFGILGFIFQQACTEVHGK